MAECCKIHREACDAKHAGGWRREVQYFVGLAPFDGDHWVKGVLAGNALPGHGGHGAAFDSTSLAPLAPDSSHFADLIGRQVCFFFSSSHVLFPRLTVSRIQEVIFQRLLVNG